MAVKRSGVHAMKKKPTMNQEQLKHQRELEIEKKCYKYGAVAAAIILVLIIFNSFDLLPHLNGSMRYYDGKVYGKGETDLVVLADASAHRYYNLGSYTAPEGYTVTETEMNPKTVISSHPDYNKSYCYMANESIDGFSYAYLVGTTKSMDEIADTIAAAYAVEDENGIKLDCPQLSGKTANGAKYRMVITPVQKEEYASTYFQFAPMYIEAKKGMSIMISVYFTSDSETGFPEAEVFEKIGLEIANKLELY